MLAPGVVQASEDHVRELAETMSAADRAEVWAATHSTPIQALTYARKVSRDTAYTWLVDGRVVAMWGVGFLTSLSMEGTPWMLSAEGLSRHGRTFARGSKIVAAEWRARYPILRNFVDARHKVALRWVEWMGFTILPAIPYGMDGLPFHPFESVR